MKGDDSVKKTKAVHKWAYEMKVCWLDDLLPTNRTLRGLLWLVKDKIHNLVLLKEIMQPPTRFCFAQCDSFCLHVRPVEGGKASSPVD